MRQLLFAFFVCISISAVAQKGSWYIGGEGGYGRNSVKASGVAMDKGHRWSIAPEIGVNLTASTQLGLAVNFSGAVSSAGAFNEQTFRYWRPQMYVRNFCKITENFSLFGGVYFQYIDGWTKEAHTKVQDISGFAGDVKIGLGYTLAERWVILGTYGLFNWTYENHKDDLGRVITNNDWFLGVNTLGPVFNVGFYYFFIKR